MERGYKTIDLAKLPEPIEVKGDDKMAVAFNNLRNVLMKDWKRVLEDNVMHSAGDITNIIAGEVATSWKTTTVADVAYTASIDDQYIEYTSLTTTRIVTLPLVADVVDGKYYVVKDGTGNAAAGKKITVDGNGAETVDGSANYEIDSAYGWVLLVKRGTEWHVVRDTDSGTGTVWTRKDINITAGAGYTHSSSENLIVNAGSANGYPVVTLPDAVTWGAKPLAVRQNTANAGSGSGYGLYVQRAGSDTVESGTKVNLSVHGYADVILCPEGTQWNIISGGPFAIVI